MASAATCHRNRQPDHVLESVLTHSNFIGQEPTQPNRVKKGTRPHDLRARQTGELLRECGQQIDRILHDDEYGIGSEGAHRLDHAPDNPQVAVHVLHAGFSDRELGTSSDENNVALSGLVICPCSDTRFCASAHSADVGEFLDLGISELSFDIDQDEFARN